jgi:hypothetical protein
MTERLIPLSPRAVFVGFDQAYPDHGTAEPARRRFKSNKAVYDVVRSQVSKTAIEGASLYYACLTVAAILADVALPEIAQADIDTWLSQPMSALPDVEFTNMIDMFEDRDEWLLGAGVVYGLYAAHYDRAA